MKANVDAVDVYLADDQPYYHFLTHTIYPAATKGRKVNVPAPLTGEAPLLVRGGSVVPTRQRVRRSAELGILDPITLTVALNKPRGSAASRASGKLYLDDGETYDHETGSYMWRKFDWLTGADAHSHSLSSKNADLSKVGSDVGDERGLGKSSHSQDFLRMTASVRLERVVVLGLGKEPTKITAAQGGKTLDLSFTWHAGSAAGAASSKLSTSTQQASRLVIKDPSLLLSEDWTIEVN